MPKYNRAPRYGDDGKNFVTGIGQGIIGGTGGLLATVGSLLKAGGKRDRRDLNKAADLGLNTVSDVLAGTEKAVLGGVVSAVEETLSAVLEAKSIALQKIYREEPKRRGKVSNRIVSFADGISDFAGKGALFLSQGIGSLAGKLVDKITGRTPQITNITKKAGEDITSLFRDTLRNETFVKGERKGEGSYDSDSYKTAMMREYRG